MGKKYMRQLKILLGVFIATNCHALDKFTYQAIDCGHGQLGACRALREHCQDGEDLACAHLAVTVLYEAFDYITAKEIVEIGCKHKGPKSCELLKYYPAEIRNACRRHWPGACEEAKKYD